MSINLLELKTLYFYGTHHYLDGFLSPYILGNHHKTSLIPGSSISFILAKSSLFYNSVETLIPVITNICSAT